MMVYCPMVALVLWVIGILWIPICSTPRRED
jgi:hypothetical protein